MAWRSAGSLSRSLSRASSLRSSPPMPRLRPPPSTPRHHPRRFAFASPRNLGELGCTASFLPFQSVAAGARLMAVNVRAYSELSHGTFRRTCQDR